MKRKNPLYYLAAAVAFITAALYLPSLWNGFVLWDDNRYVYENIHIRSLDLAFFKWAFTDVSEKFWQPLAWLFHAIDYALWGLNPAGHHLTSVLLHSLNTGLVVFLVVRMRRAAPTSGGESGSRVSSDRSVLVTAGVTALLFGIHPLQVESVAWATAKHDPLFTLFFLLSGLSYLGFAAGREAGAVRKAPGIVFFNAQYLLSFVFFVLSLSSKPAAVVLPAVLLILDWHPLQRLRSWKGLIWPIIEKLPFIAVSLLVSIMTVVWHHAQGSMASLESLPVSSRLLVSAKALVLYLWKTIFPINLVPYYPYPKEISFGAFEYFLPLAVVCAITAACLVLAKKRPAVLAAWLFYLVTLLPVLGLVQVREVFMADRYLYLPLLGPLLLIGAAMENLWLKDWLPQRAAHTARYTAGAVMIVITVLLAYGTIRQIAIWKNTINLWSFVIEKEPGRVPSAYNNRGWVFKQQKQYDRAMEDFSAAIAIEPAAAYLAYNNRGLLWQELGEYKRALEDFNRAIAIEDKRHLAYGNRGLLFIAMGDPGRAELDFSTAINLNPSYADAFTSRGLLYQETGRIEEAFEDLNKAVSLNPFSPDAYLNRGVVFEQKGELDRALSDYSDAIALSPSDYLAFRNRAIAYSKVNRFDKGVEDYTKAIFLAPEITYLYLERGNLYLKIGETMRAKSDFETACRQGNQAGCRKSGHFKGA